MKPIADLLKEPDTARRFFWADLLLANGLSMVAGQPKKGKSTLIRNLAAATVAHGGRPLTERTFLNIPLIGGPVIYLALEDDEEEIKRRMRALGVTANDPLYVECGSRQFKNDGAAIDWLTEQIQAVRPVLCVIDPIFRFLKPRSITNYASVTQMMEPLLKLARGLGCHILTAHHTTKGRTKDPMSAILGSTAIFGAVDSAFVIDSTQDWDPRFSDFRTITARLKYGRGFPHRPVRSDPRRWAPFAFYRCIDGENGERIEEAQEAWWELWIANIGWEMGITAPGYLDDDEKDRTLN